MRWTDTPERLLYITTLYFQRKQLNVCCMCFRCFERKRHVFFCKVASSQRATWRRFRDHTSNSLWTEQLGHPLRTRLDSSGQFASAVSAPNSLPVPETGLTHSAAFSMGAVVTEGL
ncbi:unnamed protein product [Knipowitschia caucasica]